MRYSPLTTAIVAGIAGIAGMAADASWLSVDDRRSRIQHRAPKRHRNTCDAKGLAARRKANKVARKQRAKGRRK